MARIRTHKRTMSPLVAGVFIFGLFLVAALNLAPSHLIHRDLHSATAKESLRRETELVVSGSARTLRKRGSRTHLFEHTFGADTAEAASSATLAEPGAEDASGAAAGEEAAVAATGEGAAATSEAVTLETEVAALKAAGDEKYHVIISLSSGIYTQWQSRVCYHWYKKLKEQHPDSAMGGFTRLLHSGQPDGYEDEIPTVVVDPLPRELQEIAHGYVVLERPYAFQQWVRQYAHTIPDRPAAFPFFYIEPKRFQRIIDRFNPRKACGRGRGKEAAAAGGGWASAAPPAACHRVAIEDFAPIGNSPVMIHKGQLASIVDSWANISFALKQDAEADKEFGWVLEMYAYSIASAQAAGGPIQYGLHLEWQLQPPWDSKLTANNGEEAYMIHFTYGNDFDLQGKFTPGKVGAWHWDKRDWTVKYPPRNFPLPPKGCTNQAVIELRCMALQRGVGTVNGTVPMLDRLDSAHAALLEAGLTVIDVVAAAARPVPERGGGGAQAALGRTQEQQARAQPQLSQQLQQEPQPQGQAQPQQSQGQEQGQEKYHMLISDGGGTYSQWQSRVCYYWYTNAKERHPDSALGGFTRLLHSGEPDEFLDEVPTLVLDRLPAPLDAYAVVNYGPLHRPYAFLQWALHHRHAIPEQYVFLAEPDHLLRAPPPLLATPDWPASFPFFYMVSSSASSSSSSINAIPVAAVPRYFHSLLLQKFNPRGVGLDDFDPTGSAPLLIHKEQFARVALGWHTTALGIKADPEANLEFGWVQEMYAYVIAAAQAEGGPVHHRLIPELMAQPPLDEVLTVGGKPVYLLHYTWPQDYARNGSRMCYPPMEVIQCTGEWSFDKRRYWFEYPPRPLEPPPPGASEAVRELVAMVVRCNETGEMYKIEASWEGGAAGRNYSKVRRLLSPAAYEEAGWPKAESVPCASVLSCRLGPAMPVSLAPPPAPPAAALVAEAAAVDPWPRAASRGGKYHVVVTADGSVGHQWQARASHYWYKKLKQQHPDSAMGAFTRILHSGQPDGAMDEVPTLVVPPLNGAHYLQRSHALAQLLRRRRRRRMAEDYLLVLDPDMLLLAPPPLWAEPRRPAAFMLGAGWTQQREAWAVNLLARFNPTRRTQNDWEAVGPSPLQIHKVLLESILDAWLNISAAIWHDPALAARPPEVLEKLAYLMAAAQAPGGPIRHHLLPQFLALPPYQGLVLEFNGTLHPPLEEGACAGAAPGARRAAAPGSPRPAPGAAGGSRGGAGGAGGTTGDAGGTCPPYFAPYLLHYAHDAAFAADGRWLQPAPGLRGDWHFSRGDWAAAYPPHPFPPLPAGCLPQCEGVVEVLRRIGEAAAQLPGWGAGAGAAPAAAQARQQAAQLATLQQHSQPQPQLQQQPQEQQAAQPRQQQQSEGGGDAHAPQTN
eukprot:scaffold23.g4186.t1